MYVGGLHTHNTKENSTQENSVSCQPVTRTGDDDALSSFHSPLNLYSWARVSSPSPGCAPTSWRRVTPSELTFDC